jgi:hypothetical protein
VKKEIINYTVSLKALDKNRKPCGEPKEFVFYKEAENAGFVEYGTTAFIDTGTTIINFSTPVIAITILSTCTKLFA